MWALIGDLIPQIMALVIAPTSVIAAVVTLSTPRAKRNISLMVGAGLIAASVVMGISIFAANSNTPSSSHVPAWDGYLKFAVGLLFAFLAYKAFKALRHPTGKPPAWLEKLDSLSGAGFIGIGVYLGAVNPKSLAMLISMGADMGATKLGPADNALLVAILALISTVCMLVPMIYDFIGGKKAKVLLGDVRQFMEKNNSIIMLVLFLVMTAVFIGKGISILAA